MKVKATQLKIEIEERTTAIICNRCSRRVEAEGKFGIVAKMWEIDIHGGFDSHGPLVGDNEILRFAACEECLLAWTATFEIPPECESTMFYNPIPGHRVDTEEAVIVRGGYVYPADTPADFVYPDLEEVEATWPEPGVWRISYTVRDGPDKPWTMWKGLVEISSNRIGTQAPTTWSRMVSDLSLSCSNARSRRSGRSLCHLENVR